MTKSEKEKRLAELLEIKKTRKLDDKEFKEFKKLQTELGVMSKNRPFKPGNDYSWWSKEESIIKDAVNLASNAIAGRKVFGDTSLNTAVIPGTAVLWMENIYGSELSGTDPLNLQFRDLFLRMFQKYRGITQYQYSDLAIVMIAVIEVVIMVARLERIYGIINRYDKLNINLPYSLLEGLGLSTAEADQIRTHLSDYRFDLNVLIRKAMRLSIPKDMTILANKISLYGYVYKDHDAGRAQFYAFDCHKAGFFDETTLTTGSAIEFKNGFNVRTSGAIVDTDFIQLVDPTSTMFPCLNAMIDRLVNSDSANRIFADLCVWFGEDAMLQILPLTEDYVIDPVYSESILHKIHNTDVYCSNSSSGSSAFDWNLLQSIIPSAMAAADRTAIDSSNNRFIFQTPAGVVCTTCCLQDDDTLPLSTPFSYRGLSVYGRTSITLNDTEFARLTEFGRILDAYHNEFSPEIVCEGVLWKNIPYVANIAANTYVVVMGAGVAEICVGCLVCGMSSNGTPTYKSQMNANDPYNNLALVSNFDWHPVIYEISQSGSDYIVYSLFGDIDTYRSLSANEITRIHHAAVLSAFKTEVTVVNK